MFARSWIWISFLFCIFRSWQAGVHGYEYVRALAGVRRRGSGGGGGGGARRGRVRRWRTPSACPAVVGVQRSTTSEAEKTKRISEEVHTQTPPRVLHDRPQAKTITTHGPDSGPRTGASPPASRTRWPLRSTGPPSPRTCAPAESPGPEKPRGVRVQTGVGRGRRGGTDTLLVVLHIRTGERTRLGKTS